MIKVGDRFKRLEVIELNVSPQVEKEYAKRIGKWHRCKCICGEIVVVPEMSLLNNSCTSCGCYKKELMKEQIKVNREKMIQNGNTTAPISKTMNLEFQGETKTLTQWANTIGISKQALSRRLKNKTPEEALSMKGRKKNGN